MAKGLFPIGACPCASCCESRGERKCNHHTLRTLIFKRPLGMKPTVRAEVQWRPPERVSVLDFTDELFEQVVVRERRAMIVTNMDTLLDRQLWDLEARIAERGSEDTQCPPDALMNVRIQAVRPVVVSQMSSELFVVR